MAGTVLRLDPQAVVQVVGGISLRACLAAANTTIEHIEENVKADGLVNTGALLRSFDVRNETSDPMRPSLAIFSSVSYAVFPEYGTRGSDAGPGRVLAFKPKGASATVFRRRTGPVRAYGFMARAAAAIEAADFAGGDKYGGMFGR